MKWNIEKHYLFFSNIGAYRIFFKKYFKPFKSKPFYEKDDYHEKVFGSGANIFWAFGLKKNFRKGFLYFHKRVSEDYYKIKDEQERARNKSKFIDKFKDKEKPKTFENFPKISFLLVQDFTDDELVLEEKIFYFSFLDFYSFLHGNSIFIPLKLDFENDFDLFNDSVNFLSDSGFLESSLYDILYSEIFLYRLGNFFKRKDPSLLYTFEYWLYDFLKYPQLFKSYIDTDYEKHFFVKPNFMRLRWVEIAEQLPPYDYPHELTQGFIKTDVYDNLFDPWFIIKYFSFLKKKTIGHTELKLLSFFHIYIKEEDLPTSKIESMQKASNDFRKYNRSRYVPLFLIFRKFYFFKKFKTMFKKKDILKDVKRRYFFFYLSNGIFSRQSVFFRKKNKFIKKKFNIRFRFNVYKRDEPDKRHDYFKDLVSFENRFIEDVISSVPEWHRIEFIIESFDKFFIYPDARFLFRRTNNTTRFGKFFFNTIRISDILISPFSQESWMLKLASRSSGHIRENNIFFDIYSKLYSVVGIASYNDVFHQKLSGAWNLRPLSFYDDDINILKKLKIEKTRILTKNLVNASNDVFSMYTKNKNVSFFSSKNLIKKSFLLPNFFFINF